MEKVVPTIWYAFLKRHTTWHVMCYITWQLFYIWQEGGEWVGEIVGAKLITFIQTAIVLCKITYLST